MPRLQAFLPPHLVRSLARRDARPPRRERFQAALLFSDISGFTALTETLQARGRAGAEEIAQVVSRAFRPAILAIEHEGGSIVSFGGDALFALFPCGVRSALRAAGDILHAFSRIGTIETSSGPVRLGIAQAVHHGTVLGLHLGREDRRHYLVAGPAVRALARLEARASAGHVLVSTAARRRERAERRGSGLRRGRAKVSRRLVESYLPHALVPLLGRFPGEYRKATVVFMETASESVVSLQRLFVTLDEALATYGGVLLKTDLSSSGTKWVAVFGIPAIHEDDTERAARASLAIRETMPRFRMRAGIHTGILVNVEVGTRSRRSFDIMGDVVNTAARAMAQAAWGEIVLTAAARAELRSVETELKGSFAAKGKAEPIEIHRALSVKVRREEVRAIAPLVGRAGEMAVLRDALGSAREGRGSVIGIVGEAGLGKSRLKWETAKLAREMGVRAFEGRAIAVGGMPFHAMRELLGGCLGLPPGAAPESILHSVRQAAEEMGLSTTDRHHLAEVLGARYERSPIPHLDGKALRQNNMIAIRSYVRALARETPYLLVLEDMHWSDELTREAVATLSRSVSETHLALLLLYRPAPPYPLPDGSREIRLSEISGDAVDQMLASLLGDPSETVSRLVRERAEGNPLYVEEVVRHMKEQGLLERHGGGYLLAREPGPEDLPGTIESLIAARLDALSQNGKRVAQHGAVVGRTFAGELVRRMADRGVSTDAGLSDLMGREIVFPAAPKPPEEYIFKHALTRDVAYASILLSRRRVLHRLAAETIETLHASERDAYLALLGHHWENAGEAAKARSFYLAGARKASSAFAHDEAERLYRACLALEEKPAVETISARIDLGARVLLARGRHADAIEVLGQALDLSRAIGAAAQEIQALRFMGNALRITGRIDESQVQHELSLQLCRERGERTEEGITLCDLAVGQMEQGRLPKAQALYEEALRIQREMGNHAMEGVVLANLATVEQNRGRQSDALRLFGDALARFRQAMDRKNEANTLTNLATLHMELGELQEASDLYQMALGIHRELGYRRSESVVLLNLALLHNTRGSYDLAGQLYEQALAIQREIADRRSEGVTMGNLAVLRTHEGRYGEARELLTKALEVSRSLGDRRFEGIWLTSLAFLHNEEGEPESAKRAATAALASFTAVGDRRNEAIARMELGIGTLALGQVKEALERLESAHERLASVGERTELPRCLCFLGEARLARGIPADDLLAEAERHANELHALQGSAVHRAVERLREAVLRQAQRAAGQP